MCEKKDKIIFGSIVTSLMGHDFGRKYLVVKELNENFVLVCDGKYRKLDNPKQKRKKHLKAESLIELSDLGVLSDNDIRKLLNL